ncbi:hypothetical protein ACFV4M_12770 [Kitasatospora indigofera]
MGESFAAAGGAPAAAGHLEALLSRTGRTGGPDGRDRPAENAPGLRTS